MKLTLVLKGQLSWIELKRLRIDRATDKCFIECYKKQGQYENNLLVDNILVVFMMCRATLYFYANCTGKNIMSELKLCIYVCIIYTRTAMDIVGPLKKSRAGCK